MSNYTIDIEIKDLVYDSDVIVDIINEFNDFNDEYNIIVKIWNKNDILLVEMRDVKDDITLEKIITIWVKD